MKYFFLKKSRIILICPQHFPTDTDGGKLQCCSKAVTPKCWMLCSEMYRSPLGVPKNYQEFDMLCTYNPQEAALMNCLADVTKPCQLGCSGLNFCTNFNNRHTELFRSCDANSDTFAKSHMQQWHGGVIKVPGIPIVVQDIKKCLPETWKVSIDVEIDKSLMEIGSRLIVYISVE